MLIKFNNYLVRYDKYNNMLFIGKRIIFSQYKIPQYYFYYNNEYIKLTNYIYVIYFCDLKRNKEIGIERKLNYRNSVENYHIFICGGILDLFIRKKSKSYDNEILKIFKYIKNYVNQI